MMRTQIKDRVYILKYMTLFFKYHTLPILKYVKNKDAIFEFAPIFKKWDESNGKMALNDLKKDFKEDFNASEERFNVAVHSLLDDGLLEKDDETNELIITKKGFLYYESERFKKEFEELKMKKFNYFKDLTAITISIISLLISIFAFLKN